MERVENISISAWPLAIRHHRTRLSTKGFVIIVIFSACLAALFAGWLPLQMSVATVFLFAGPHNWFELRYFLMRLPVRLGRSRNFFFLAFAGIGLLTLGYVSCRRCITRMCGQVPIGPTQSPPGIPL